MHLVSIIFFIQSPSYPWFLGKLSTLTHFPLDPDYEDYSYIDHTFRDFDSETMNFNLKDLVEMPELDTFFEPDAKASSVS